MPLGSQVDCSKCEHCYFPNEKCLYEFERASGAAGQAVDSIWDVFRCRDYSPNFEEEDDDE